MKFAKIALAASLALAGVSVAHADDQGHGTVTFIGSIISAPCSITPDTVDQTVNLGQVSDAALKDQGTSTPVPFNIKLDNCDPSSLTDGTVTVTFSGMADAADSSMLGLNGSAAGAGIVIASQSGKQIDLGTPSDAQKLATGAEQNTLEFSSWLKGDTAGGNATPGDFQSVADFQLAYQ